MTQDCVGHSLSSPMGFALAVFPKRDAVRIEFV